MKEQISWPEGDADIAAKCEHAIGVAVRHLAESMITTGWPPEATFEAIRRVAYREADAYRQDPDRADDPVESRTPAPFSFAPF